MPLLSWYVDISVYIAKYNYEHIPSEKIRTYDDNQDILTHYSQKRDLWTICISIYTSHHQFTKNEFMGKFKNVTFKFWLCYDLHNS